ncbi:diguanylate cyclase [Acaryochloris sp. IP29b_bin.137]|uniref:GGDEF domain-containing protein n=1 Tax=Acaryochloris sp. IP29b_bin.137 TaxID=2969217 RepID=UPI0026260792|nr:diguanylate cyclase [Acaryochloris sp. IP29b_bin.137]
MHTAHRNILIISDDEQDVEIIREALGKNHDFPIDLFHCFTLAESIEFLQSGLPIDLILLNLCINGTEGLKRFDQIHQAFPSIPLIILSENIDEAVARQAMQAGAQDYLVKGRFTHSHLCRSIQYALERQGLLCELEAKNRDLQSLSAQLEAVHQRLESLSTIDGLTQVSNRRGFDETFLSEWNRLCRDVHPLALILCEVDHFKAFNDTYGYSVGEDRLRDVAQVIAKIAKRPADCVARYGGESFAIILPNTDLEGATQVAEAIRNAIEALAIPHVASSTSDTVSVSLGVASQVPDENVAPSILIEAADRALYVAQQQGRDRIQTHQKDCSALESRRTLELADRLHNALDQRRQGKQRMDSGALFTS